MDRNEVEKIRIGFGPEKEGEISPIWDKHLKRYRNLELDKGTVLLDGVPLESLKEILYEYALVNWSKKDS